MYQKRESVLLKTEALNQGKTLAVVRLSKARKIVLHTDCSKIN